VATTRKKKTKSKKAGPAATASVDLRLPAKLGVKVHIHALPRCKGEDHDASCANKPLEVSCNQVSIFGKKIAVCTHTK